MSTAASIRQLCIVTEAALSFVGAGIAGILWWQERTAAELPCGPLGGCGAVWASLWSHIDIGPWHDIPVAMLGLFGYILLLSLSMLRLGSDSESTNRFAMRLAWLVSMGGTAYSWYLQWISHTKIGHICPWCMSSAIIMTLIFFLTTYEHTAARKSALLSQMIERGEHTTNAS